MGTATRTLVYASSLTHNAVACHGQDVRRGAMESSHLNSFNDLGLAESVLRAVAAEGFETPTPIQAEVIPTMLRGRDVVGIAQTGTGKTASFVLPLLHTIAEGGKPPAPKSCRALILAPTRELVSQIAENVRLLGKTVRPKTAIVVGGAKPGPQIKAMARGVDILVATPGRLLDHLSTGAIRLDQTHTVVLDEADQMLDLGFLPAIRRIMAQVPAARQTLLLSATMPKQIRALAQDFLKNPAEISVAPASRPIERIDQKVLHVEGPAKRAVLTDLLQGQSIDRAIVFTRTKRGADRVCRHLQNAGLSVEALHGDKSQGQRVRILKAFRGGTLTVLVATDIAARGIDVDGVSHVINFELPNVPEAYVHRIGRTARAGKSGSAVSLCAPDERPLLRDIEKLIGRRFDGTPADLSDTEARPSNGRGARPGGASRQGGKPRPNTPAKARRGKPAGAKRRHPEESRSAKPSAGKAGARPSNGDRNTRRARKTTAAEDREGLSRMLGA